jgi:Sulfatase
MSCHRKIDGMTGWKGIIVILVTLVIGAGLVIFLLNTAKIHLPTLNSSMNRALRRSELLLERAERFDEKEALRALGVNRRNGFYYRFDEQIDDAIPIDLERNIEINHDEKKGFSFEFDGTDIIHLRPHKIGARLNDGLLKMTYTDGDYLRNLMELSISKDEIGEIEIRVKLKHGKKITLAWSKYMDVELREDNKVGKLNIYTVPDNKFHVYKIEAGTTLKRHLDIGDIIRRIFLVPSDVDGDEVEIDYIRFVPRSAKYREKPYSPAYETIGGEMRQVLYTLSPFCLKYVLTIPEGEVYLSYGMGILENRNPVLFKVIIESENTREEIFSSEVKDNEEWRDEKLDLSRWSGQKVGILFKTWSGERNIAFWSNPILYIPPARKFNVIIALEDALRADHMSCYGYPRETTPIKDKMIQNGVLFLHAFSQGTKTRPSCPAIMTSLYPTVTGVWSFSEMLDDNYLTLAEILRNQGFVTASFIQNGNAGPFAGLHQGFSFLFDEGMGASAHQVYGKKLFRWIKEHQDRNFFIYLHLIDPHGEYDPIKSFNSWFKEAPPGKTLVERDKRLDPDWVELPSLEGRRLLYDGEIAYNDYCFKYLLKELKKSNLAKNTLLIFTGDHGEHLGEHGLWEHCLPGYIQVLHVPLLMVLPGVLPAGVKIIQPVQHIDIMPTILELAGIDGSGLLLQGDSLLPLINKETPEFWENRLCISEEVVENEKDDKIELGSLFFRDRHVLNSKYFNEIKVFNYLKDKEEEHPEKLFLAALPFNFLVKRFLRRFQSNNVKIWEKLTRGRKEEVKQKPEVQEQLRALGYIN